MKESAAIPAVRNGGSTPISPAQDYHAILRHEEEVGNEGAPTRIKGGFSPRWPLLARTGAALAVSAVLSPLVFLALSPSNPNLIFVLLVNAATAGLAVFVGHWITRHEIKTWAFRMVQRTEKIFAGKSGSGPAQHEDFETYLDDLAQSLERTVESQLQHERNTIIGTITSLISALEARDPYTRNHSARVAQLAVRVGKRMGLDRSHLYEIHLGGILHDVGKIGIPDAILLKPGGLTNEEYEVMKTHSYLGARILSGIPGLEAVVQIVLNHHEMYDGRGYPNGVAGEDIPLGARIVAVCDTYLSMTEDRPYRQGRTLDRVLKEINRVSGKQLDPNVVETLQALLIEETERFGRPLFGFSAPEEDEARSRAA